MVGFSVWMGKFSIEFILRFADRYKIKLCASQSSKTSNSPEKATLCREAGSHANCQKYSKNCQWRRTNHHQEETQNISHIFRKILLVRIGFGVFFFGLSSVLLFSFTVSVPSPPLRDIVVGALFLGFGLICGASVSRGFSSFVLLYLPSVLRWPSREGAFQNRRRCPFQSRFCSVFIHAHFHTNTVLRTAKSYRSFVWLIINSDGSRYPETPDSVQLQNRSQNLASSCKCDINLRRDSAFFFFAITNLSQNREIPLCRRKSVGGVTGEGVPVGGRFGRWRRRHYLKIRSVCRGGCCSRPNIRREEACNKVKKVSKIFGWIGQLLLRGMEKVGGVAGPFWPINGYLWSCCCWVQCELFRALNSKVGAKCVFSFFWLLFYWFETLHCSNIRPQICGVYGTMEGVGSMSHFVHVRISDEISTLS